MTHLVNSSIIKGNFPDELKIAKVIPIFKSGNKDSIENYRPISIISVFTKVLKKIMYKHLINFVDKMTFSININLVSEDNIQLITLS